MKLIRKLAPLHILVSFSFLPKLSSGQYSFFISPELSFKTSIAFVDPANLYTTENNLLENQYFYKPYAVSYSARLVKRQLAIYGMSFGMKFRGDTRFVKLTYAKDCLSYRSYSSFRNYYDSEHYGFVNNYHNVGFHRLMLDYGLKIKSKSTIFQAWFTFGGGVNINRNNWTGIFPIQWGLQLNPNGDELLRTYIQPFAEKRVNGCLKVGFDTDFFLRKKYLLTLSFQYIQGFGVLSRIEHVHEYKLDGEFVYDGTGIMSRGSGFYWGVKRNFQVFPWKRKSKRVQSISS